MEAAQFVRDIKTEVRQQMAGVEEPQAQRPVAHEPRRLPTYSVEIELIEKLKRIHDCSSQMTELCYSERQTRFTKGNDTGSLIELNFFNQVECLVDKISTASATSSARLVTAPSCLKIPFS